MSDDHELLAEQYRCFEIAFKLRRFKLPTNNCVILVGYMFVNVKYIPRSCDVDVPLFSSFHVLNHTDGETILVR